MHTYIADFEYENNAANTMGAQSYMFDASCIQAAAAIAEAFRAGLARNDDWAETIVKKVAIAIPADHK